MIYRLAPVSIARLSITSVSLVLLVLLGGRPAHADSDPHAVIEKFCAQLLDVMKHGQALGFTGRAEKLRPAVAAAYDMPAMTRSTLGAAGGRLSPDDAQKIAEAYTRLSVATYAQNFSGWNGERFEVDAARPAANGQVVVPTRLIQSDGKPVSIDYLMKDDGGWRIVDVLFDGAISQVAMRRSEVLPVFRQSGVDGLTAVLEAKSQAMSSSTGDNQAAGPPAGGGQTAGNK